MCGLALIVSRTARQLYMVLLYGMMPTCGGISAVRPPSGRHTCDIHSRRQVVHDSDTLGRAQEHHSHDVVELLARCQRCLRPGLGDCEWSLSSKAVAKSRTAAHHGWLCVAGKLAAAAVTCQGQCLLGHNSTAQRNSYEQWLGRENHSYCL